MSRSFLVFGAGAWGTALSIQLIKSKNKVCSFLKNSDKSEFISDVNLISKQQSLKGISYKDQFGTNTQINFIKIKLNEELDRKIFDYNKNTNLYILN